MMQLERLHLLACAFVDDRTGAEQTANEIGAVVAGLCGSSLPDDGKAIAFAAAALLAAGCAGMRIFSLRILVNEIRSAERAAL